MLKAETDIKTEYSLGVVVVSETGKNELEILIPKGSTIPATGGKEFYTRIENQQELSVRVMEGEDPDIRFDTPIGISRISLRKKYRKNAPLRYRMTCNADKTICIEIIDEDHEQVGSAKFKRGDHIAVSRLGEAVLESEAMKQLDSLTGLTEIKEYVSDIRSQILFEKYRREKLGIAEEISLPENLVFSGNPGTGKTTVARIMGDIYRELGILPKGHLIETSRADTVKGYQGQTAIRMNELINDAIGGVLFIDEAYALKTDNCDSFGQEAVDTLVKGIEDNRGKLVVILAGYRAEMEDFLKSNTGLSSRFQRFMEFPDYTEEELLNVAKDMAASKHFTISRDGENAFLASISRLKLGNEFGNVRAVRSIIEGAILRKARDFSESGKDIEDIDVLRPSDFGGDPDIEPADKAKKSLDELNCLIGLSNVKHEIEALTAIARYRLDEGISDTDLPMNMNMVFSGNPGTGKTTVARIFGQILCDIGILKKGQLIEVSRSDLIGRYQGHTAIKTREVCQKAYGGILFIDEAYSLVNGDTDTFGMEAVATLIKEMEDNRDKLVVVLAGYTEEMSDFLNSNSGIRSRIGEIIEFPDYDEDELMEILKGCLSERGIIAPDDTLSKAENAISALKNKSNFGNARDIRNLTDDIWKNMVIRVEKNKLKGEERKIAIPEDVPTIMPGN